MSWLLADLQTLFIATPAGAVALLVLALFGDQLFLLLPARLFASALGRTAGPSNERLPAGLLVIPSLLRAADELEAIKATVSNVLENDYPGTMIIVTSIDGTREAPKLYADLEAWFASRQASLPKDVSLHLTGTPRRHGKPLAIEHGIRHVQALVARGVHAALPAIYFSTDADADLGPHALELLARRLTKKSFFTGNPGRAVAGHLHVRKEQYWRGWRHFFSVEGQLTLQVAREYLVTSVMRHNVRPLPICGIPGALYCTWTDLMIEGPRFMGFMKTLNRRDWIKWWLGAAPPKFSESKVSPIPELLAGDTDDTVSAFLAILARWENGKLTLDAPRTPLHALYFMLRSFFVDRALRYEPEARVYTSSPSTVGSLWRQRMRWNASRIEVVGRFSRSFRYHWDLSVAGFGSVGLMLKCAVFGLFAYVQAPLVMAKGGFLVPIALGLAVHYAIYTAATLLALAVGGGVGAKWRLVLAIPLAPIYMPVYGFWAGAAGMAKDVLLVGNCTKFAPEETLIRGGSERIALFARLRRAAVLMVRSAFYGDVPLASFWFGWGETKWTPSGYQGWTTGKRPSLYERLRHGAKQAPSSSARTPVLAIVRPLPVRVLAAAKVIEESAEKRAA
jgi:hypothetical protein